MKYNLWQNIYLHSSSLLLLLNPVASICQLSAQHKNCGKKAIMHATKQWRDQHWIQSCKECLNLFKQTEARKQPNNMFGCSYTWTQPRLYNEYISQLLQYRIIITACEEALISVLHGSTDSACASTTRECSQLPGTTGVSHWPLMMSPLCSPLADKQNALMLATQHFAWQLQESW